MYFETHAVQSAARITSDQRRHPFQIFRLPVVVGIEQRDVIALRLGNAPVAGRRYAAVRLPDQAHAGQVQPFDHPGAIIGRTVIHHDHFQRRIGLRRNASERAGNFPPFIIQGNNYRKCNIHN